MASTYGFYDYPSYSSPSKAPSSLSGYSSASAPSSLSGYSSASAPSSLSGYSSASVKQEEKPMHPRTFYNTVAVPLAMQELRKDLPQGATISFDPNTKEFSIYLPNAPEGWKNLSGQGDILKKDLQKQIAYVAENAMLGQQKVSFPIVGVATKGLGTQLQGYSETEKPQVLLSPVNRAKFPDINELRMKPTLSDISPEALSVSMAALEFNRRTGKNLPGGSSISFENKRLVFTTPDNKRVAFATNIDVGRGEMTYNIGGKTFKEIPNPKPQPEINMAQKEVTYDFGGDFKFKIKEPAPKTQSFFTEVEPKESFRIVPVSAPTPDTKNAYLVPTSNKPPNFLEAPDYTLRPFGFGLSQRIEKRFGKAKIDEPMALGAIRGMAGILDIIGEIPKSPLYAGASFAEGQISFIKKDLPAAGSLLLKGKLPTGLIGQLATAKALFSIPKFATKIKPILKEYEGKVGEANTLTMMSKEKYVSQSRLILNEETVLEVETVAAIDLKPTKAQVAGIEVAGTGAIPFKSSEVGLMRGTETIRLISRKTGDTILQETKPLKSDYLFGTEKNVQLTGAMAAELSSGTLKAGASNIIFDSKGVKIFTSRGKGVFETTKFDYKPATPTQITKMSGLLAEGTTPKNVNLFAYSKEQFNLSPFVASTKTNIMPIPIRTGFMAKTRARLELYRNIIGRKGITVREVAIMYPDEFYGNTGLDLTNMRSPLNYLESMKGTIYAKIAPSTSARLLSKYSSYKIPSNGYNVQVFGGASNFITNSRTGTATKVVSEQRLVQTEMPGYETTLLPKQTYKMQSQSLSSTSLQPQKSTETFTGRFITKISETYEPRFGSQYTSKLTDKYTQKYEPKTTQAFTQKLADPFQTTYSTKYATKFSQKFEDTFSTKFSSKFSSRFSPKFQGQFAEKYADRFAGAENIKKPRPPPPGIIINIGENRQEKPSSLGFSQKEQAYNSYARRSGNFQKLNRYPLTKQQALALGGEATDNSAAQTFKVSKTSGEPKQDAAAGYSYPSYKFKTLKKTPETEVYREKKSNLIDTQGEVMGISAKGWVAQRRKKVKSGFI